MQDQSVRIRVNALYATKAFSPTFDSTIILLLSDESVSVRELSRDLLKFKSLDFPEIYRERIKHELFLSGSLTGLSEIGTIKDLQTFEQHINSNKSKIVTGCLIAINKFSPEKAKSYL